MALLLRMGGVPARVATGFSPGGYSKSRGAWIVRDTDAHAWVEAWFDRFGWVTFDPTPDATPARSQIAALGPSLPPIAISADRVTPGPGSSRSEAPVPGGIKPGLLRDPERSVGTGGSLERTATRWWLWGAVGALALLLVAWLVALRRGPRGGTPMDRAIAELEWALRSVGRPVRTGTTLSQLERRLGSHSPEAGAYLRSLAAGRYAPAAPPPARSGRRALRRALAEGLGFGGRLRALWALPPRVR
jgi:protein-glutamine gamma-glutamyltransferase